MSLRSALILIALLALAGCSRDDDAPWVTLYGYNYQHVSRADGPSSR